jgi:hypothetical protein
MVQGEYYDQSVISRRTISWRNGYVRSASSTRTTGSSRPVGSFPLLVTIEATAGLAYLIRQLERIEEAIED